MTGGGDTEAHDDAPPEESVMAALMMRVDARFMSVREVRETLDECLMARAIPQSKRESILLAVSEALNNVCEHAYGGSSSQPIDIRLFHKNNRLSVVISDLGISLNEFDTIPEGTRPSVDTPIDALPEGGFGWFLIQTLADLVKYSRSDGRNRLTLTFNLDQEDDLFSVPS